jgi:hypothetical protein
MTKEQQLPEPTRCYIEGCDRENELMLHVADDPWLGGHYCMEHARAIVASTPLIVTCVCPICARVRRVVSDARPEATWLVITETSSYVLELDPGGSGTLFRRAGTGQGVARKQSTCRRHSPSNCVSTVRPFLCAGRRRRWSASLGH